VAAAKQVGLSKSRIFLFADTPQEVIDGVRDWRGMLGTTEEADNYYVKQFSPNKARRTIATVNYSSGTTGLPKGVCISHSALIANIEQTKFMQYGHLPEGTHDRPPERWVGFLPLYHAFGQLFVMGMSSKMHVPIHIMKSFILTDFLRIIQTKRITTLQLVPPVLVLLAKRPEVAEYDLSSLKKAVCAAAPLSKELQNEVSQRCGMKILQGWGMTELTCGAMTVPWLYDDDSGSVGLPYANTEVKLLDDDGKEVGAGTPGELYVRGPHVCLGYWKNETATKETLDSEGWLKTGDVAIRNKDCWFWIVDRKKVDIATTGPIQPLTHPRNSSKLTASKSRPPNSKPPSSRTPTSPMPPSLASHLTTMSTRAPMSS
jgi:4-coumarate--CoA ligase